MFTERPLNIWSYLVVFGVLAVFVVVVAVADPAGAGAAPQKGKGKPGGGDKTTILRMTVDDNHALGAGADYLLSDMPADPDGLVAYTDRRWPTTEGEPDRCISARLMNGGGSFIHMNQGSSMPDQCNAVYPAEARTYTMRFAAGSCPCSELNLSDDGDGFCSLTIHLDKGAARVRTSPLFKKNTSTASIDFVFKHDAGTPLAWESFELQSVEELDVTELTNDAKRLTRSDETFRLISLDRGELCIGINFALKVDIERQ